MVSLKNISGADRNVPALDGINVAADEIVEVTDELFAALVWPNTNWEVQP